MKINEALPKTSPEKWARPITWRRTGQALLVLPGGAIVIVPSSRGRDVWIPTVRDLASDWEVLDPELVLAEQSK